MAGFVTDMYGVQSVWTFYVSTFDCARAPHSKKSKAVPDRSFSDPPCNHSRELDTNTWVASLLGSGGGCIAAHQQISIEPVCLNWQWPGPGCRGLGGSSLGAWTCRGGLSSARIAAAVTGCQGQQHQGCMDVFLPWRRPAFRVLKVQTGQGPLTPNVVHEPALCLDKASFRSGATAAGNGAGSMPAQYAPRPIGSAAIAQNVFIQRHICQHPYRHSPRQASACRLTLKNGRLTFHGGIDWARAIKCKHLVDCTVVIAD